MPRAEVLGFAVMAVFVIAGLRHNGRDLVLPLSAKLALRWRQQASCVHGGEKTIQ